MEEEKKEEIEVKQTVEDTPTVPNNTVNVVTNPPIKPNKSYKGLIITLVIIILLLIAVLVYFIFFNKDKTKGNDKPQVSPTSEVVPSPETSIEPSNEESNGEHELTVYKYKDSEQLHDSSEKKDYLEVAFTIKVKGKDAKVLYVDDYSYVLYRDDKLYLYNVKNKTSEELNLEKDYLAYQLIHDWESHLVGISYLKSNYTTGFYNYQKKIKMYDGKYKAIEESNDLSDKLRGRFEMVGQYLMFSNNGDSNIYLLNKDSEQVMLSYKDKDGGLYAYREIGDRENNKFIYGMVERFEGVPIRLYSKSLKMFYDKPISLFSCDYDKEVIYIVDENKILKYNFDGDLVNTYDKYNNISELYGSYVVYVKDGNLVIENIEDTTESKVISKWDNNWIIDEVSYYKRDYLDSIDEKNKKEGIYIIIYYGYDDSQDEQRAIKDKKGNYGIEYCYTPDKQIIEYPIKHEMGGRAKPVLYLYPEKETNVEVKFEKPNLLTTTYPKYINAWNVTAKPNGDLKDSDGKYYYALYWDEKRYNEVDFKEGFYVESKDAIKFLEEKLTIIGLSDKERNEFIMYWLPIMENNKKNLVYFELTEERQIGNKLIIEPKPDSLLRVSIHIKKVNEKVNIPEQKLETFNRVGFTAVEWGGMTY